MGLQGLLVMHLSYNNHKNIEGYTNIYIEPYIDMSKKENISNGDASLLYYHPITVQISQYITIVHSYGSPTYL